MNQEFCDLYEELANDPAWKKSGGSKRKLARMLGVTDRTLYRWLNNEFRTPHSVIFVMRMILDKSEL